MNPVPPRTKNFFRVREDFNILNFYKNKKDTMSMTEMLSEISIESDRSVDSLKDRLKKYLMHLSSEDFLILSKNSFVSQFLDFTDLGSNT